MSERTMQVDLARAVVIGAGNMGAGIAAHLANAGVRVLLLDRVVEGSPSRSALAERAIDRQLRGSGFMHPDRARLVEAGNVEDDLARLSDADWIIEAVFEDLAIKRALYATVDRVRKPGSVVSSNTSTIPLAHLTEGLGEAFARDFVITHFFNPPRVMKLLELVGGAKTAPDTMTRAAAWCDRLLGKTVVRCRDTPGFIANRIGNYWMSVAVLDFASGEYRAIQPVQLAGLEAAGQDLKALCERPDRGGRYAWTVLSHLVSYASEVGPEIADDVASIDVAMRLGYNWSHGPFELADRVGAAWLVDRLAAEGRPVPALLRRAVERGGFYAGDRGLDTKGQRVEAGESAALPSFPAVKRRGMRVAGNDCASVWDIGEGVLALEVHSKMNACNEQVVDLLEAAPLHVRRSFRALVIANDHPRAFSVGADLGSFVGYIKAADWRGMVRFVERGQSALRALRMAPFPVVGAPFGLALGGGCELQLSCDASVAHAELNAGLPELKVGILPGWGGCTRLLERWTERCGGDAQVGAAKALDVMVDGATSHSALVAMDQGLLRRADRITMNRDRLLADARAFAIELAEAGYGPPPAPSWIVQGAGGAAQLLARIEEQRAQKGLSDHDMTVAGAMAAVLSGGDVAAGTRVSDSDILALEVQQMVALAKTPASLARMEHMLATGRPLRN